MSSAEFSQWVAYYNLHPFGTERENVHSAMIATMIGNANRGQNKPPFKVDDFMYQSDKERRVRETQQTIAYLRAHAVPKPKQ